MRHDTSTTSRRQGDKVGDPRFERENTITREIVERRRRRRRQLPRLHARDGRRRLSYSGAQGTGFGRTWTRRRPGVTAHISSTPVDGSLTPFPAASQSPLTSHRLSHRGGGTAPELRFSTFLSRAGVLSLSLSSSLHSLFATERREKSRGYVSHARSTCEQRGKGNRQDARLIPIFCGEKNTAPFCSTRLGLESWPLRIFMRLEIYAKSQTYLYDGWKICIWGNFVNVARNSGDFERRLVYWCIPWTKFKESQTMRVHRY